MGINCSFVLGGAVVVLFYIAALISFLQGGIAWPCLLLVIAFQVVAIAGARR